MEVTTSVVFHIVFVKILSNHFLDAVLYHLICNMRMSHHHIPDDEAASIRFFLMLVAFLITASKSFSIFLQSKSGSPNRLPNTPAWAKKASTILREYLIYLIYLSVCVHNNTLILRKVGNKRFYFLYLFCITIIYTKMHIFNTHHFTIWLPINIG